MRELLWHLQKRILKGVILYRSVGGGNTMNIDMHGNMKSKETVEV